MAPDKQSAVDLQATAEVNFIQCFTDLEEGIEYLKFMRSKYRIT
jgi:hypothetical protein